MGDINVDYERLEIDLLNRKVRASSKDSFDRLRELQVALKSGSARSVDEVKDFVTVLFGMWDDETTAPFRELQEEIQKNQENEILVIKKTRDKEGPLISYLHSGGSMEMMPKPDFYTTHLDLNLGRISSPLELNIQTSEIVVPVVNHVSASLKYAAFNTEPIFPGNLKWEVCEWHIKKKLEDLPHLLSEKIKLELARYMSDYDKQVESSIFFGREVQIYFSKSPSGVEFYGKAQQTISEHAKKKVHGL